jgi:hypothetical protein
MKKNLNVKKFESNLRKEFVKLYENCYIELDNFNVNYFAETIMIKVAFGRYGTEEEQFYEGYYYSELSQKVNIGIFLGGIISMFNDKGR